MTSPTINKNNQVIENWLEGKPSRNHRGSLHTNGSGLWSYSLQIGDTCQESGIKIVKHYMAGGAYGFISQTTSQHVGAAKRAAALTMHRTIIDG